MKHTEISVRMPHLSKRGVGPVGLQNRASSDRGAALDTWVAMLRTVGKSLVSFLIVDGLDELGSPCTEGAFFPNFDVRPADPPNQADLLVERPHAAVPSSIVSVISGI